MKLENLKAPAEAAEILKTSRATISRNVKLGAPVHYISTRKHRYLIDPEEYVEWLDAQGEDDSRERDRKLTVLELAAKRHAMVG